MGHMLNEDEQPQVIPGDAFKEVSNFGEPSNKCVAIFEPSVKLREFNTVKYMGYPGIAEKDQYCATLTSGRTAHGVVETSWPINVDIKNKKVSRTPKVKKMEFLTVLVPSGCTKTMRVV